MPILLPEEKPLLNLDWISETLCQLFFDRAEIYYRPPNRLQMHYQQPGYLNRCQIWAPKISNYQGRGQDF